MVTLDGWSQITVEGEDGTPYQFNLDTESLFLITALKTLISVLMVVWGYNGLKTFKPILKDLH